MWGILYAYAFSLNVAHVDIHPKYRALSNYACILVHVGIYHESPLVQGLASPAQLSAAVFDKGGKGWLIFVHPVVSLVLRIMNMRIRSNLSTRKMS